MILVLHILHRIRMISYNWRAGFEWLRFYP